MTPQKKVESLLVGTIPFPVYSPLLTMEKFAYTVGVTPDVVDGWVKRKYIPTVKIGIRRLINITALVNQLNK